MTAGLVLRLVIIERDLSTVIQKEILFSTGLLAVDQFSLTSDLAKKKLMFCFSGTAASVTFLPH